MSKFQNYNPPTIACGLVWVGNQYSGSVLTIRRGLPGFGYGKLALPGGFQEMGETLEQAVSRETHEETGILIDPDQWLHWSTCTVEGGTKNLAFFYHVPRFRDRPSDKFEEKLIELPESFLPNDEILEILVYQTQVFENRLAATSLNEPLWAFPEHYRAAKSFISSVER